MPIEISFDKAKAQAYVDCLLNGKPIESREGGWTVDEILALAGACQVAAGSSAGGNAQGPEPQEVEAAIEWCVNVTRFVVEGRYDESFDPIHRAQILIDPDGRKKFRGVSGFKWAGEVEKRAPERRTDEAT